MHSRNISLSYNVVIHTYKSTGRMFMILDGAMRFDHTKWQIINTEPAGHGSVELGDDQFNLVMS